MPLNIFGKRERKTTPRGPVITKEQFLKSKPVRNPALNWSQYPSGEVAIFVKQEPTGITKLMAKIVKPPSEKKILLDRVGSFVWSLCDGEHTVEDILKELMSKYKLQRREAEASLTLYLQMLFRRMLIGFMIPGVKPPNEKPTEEKGD